MNDIAFKLWNILPFNVRNPLDILRRCPRWNAAGVLFIHVPKAAGVSVNRTLYGRPLGHFKATEIRRICPVTFKKLLTFGVVRHPVNRLYSAYHFARLGGTSEMGIKNKEIYRSNSFNSFDKFVCEWLSKQDINAIDGVFRPQYLYLCDGDEIIVDKVVKLEDIDQGMREISGMLGRSIVLGHHNKSQSSQFVIESAETISIIEHIYQKDFSIFSY